MSEHEYIQHTAEYMLLVFNLSVDVLLAVLPQALLFSILFFIAGAFILRLLAKKNIFKRENKVWNMLAKLHYPTWIVVFMSSGFVIGALNASISHMQKNLHESFKPYIESNLPKLKSYITDQLPEYSMDEKIQVENVVTKIFTSLYYEPKSDGYFETAKARSINWVTLNFGKRIVTYSVAALAIEAQKSGQSHFYLSDETIELTKRVVLSLDFSKVNSNIAQIIYEALSGNLKSLIRNLQLQYALFFLFLLSILCVEILLYRFVLWKKNK